MTTAAASVPQTTTKPAPRRRSALGRIVRMTRFEASMIFKQRIALMSVILAPASAVGIAAFSKPEGDAAWSSLLASMCILALIMAVYTTTTSAVVGRRESQVFKRFRTSELLPRQMLTALTSPYVIVGLVQVGIVTAAYYVMGAPLPTQPLWFVVTMLGATLMCVAAGFATAAFTADSERVQFAVTPVMMIGLVSSIMVLNPGLPDAARMAVMLVPFAAFGDLAARFIGAPENTFLVPSFVTDLAEKVGMSDQALMIGINSAICLLWILVFAVAARRGWRWEPRG